MLDEIPRNGISLKGIFKFIQKLTEVTKSLPVGYKGFEPRLLNLRPIHNHELKLVELEDIVVIFVE